MGQVLCLLMILCGAVILLGRKKIPAQKQLL